MLGSLKPFSSRTALAALSSSSSSASRRARRASSTRASFEPLEDRQLLAVFTVTSNEDRLDPNDGLVTFREALTSANALVSPVQDLIQFDIGYTDPIPEGDPSQSLSGSPRSITFGSDGNLWFTTQDGRIGRSNVDGSNRTIVSVPGLPAGARLTEIVAAGNRIVFGVEGGGSAIGIVTNLAAPNPTLASVNGLTDAHAVTYHEANGSLWLGTGSRIVRVTNLADPFGSSTTFDLPPGTLGDIANGITPVIGFPDANIRDLTVGPDGRIWFTDAGGSPNASDSFNRIGWITTSGSIIPPNQIINLDQAAFGIFIQPDQIISGPNAFPDTLWFTLRSNSPQLGNAGVGRIAALNGAVTTYSLRDTDDSPAANLVPNNLAVGRDNNIYVTVGGTVPSVRRVTTGSDPNNPGIGDVESFRIFSTDFNNLNSPGVAPNPFGIVAAPASSTDRFLYFAEPSTRRLGRFDLPSLEQGFFNIEQRFQGSLGTSEFPVIVDPVQIDGYSQPDATRNTLPAGFDANLVIHLDGDAGAGAQRRIGLRIDSSNVLVQGLQIRDFADLGIEVADSIAPFGNPILGNQIQGNAILANGLVAGGASRKGGVRVITSNNFIGGTSVEQRNVINANAYGVLIGDTDSAAPVAQGNRIQNSFISGNVNDGVLIVGSNNTVGGREGSAGNSVNVNGAAGVRIVSRTSNDPNDPLRSRGNEILNNVVGMVTDLLGNWEPAGNIGAGVELDNAPENRIEGNAISSNLHGILITEVAGNAVRSTGNRILNNRIGTDTPGGRIVSVSGRLLGNSLDGVRIEASGNTIGSSATDQGNLISGNRRDGISVVRRSATDSNDGANNIIIGNVIGLDDSGLADLGNTRAGVRIEGGSRNRIGGTASGELNVISGNDQGVVIVGLGFAASDNVVQGNLIGVRATGVQDVGNAREGVLIDDGAIVNGQPSLQGRGAERNLIGGTIAAARNVISGNNQGVRITGAGSIGNLVQGNAIGTDSGLTLNLGNEQEGVLIEQGASGNTVGGEAAVGGNTIAFNVREGVQVDGANSDGNSILSNSIFRNAGAPIALTNAGNNNRLAPVLTAVLVQGTTLRIQGTVDSIDGGPVRIQFFANDPSLPGGPQAQTFLGERVVTAGSFDVVLPVALTLGQLVTATATSTGATRDTSALSGSAQTSLSEPPLVVNTTDDPLDNQIDFNDNILSLREAILRANANPDHTTVTFNIPGVGPRIIRPTRSLPSVTEPISLFGFTQPGTSLGTAIDGFSSTLQVVINGSGLASQTNPDGTLVNGLTLESDDNLVIGLVINQFPGDGILVSDARGEGRNNQIRNNFLGTDGTATDFLGNGGAGIRFLAPNNQLGGNVANAKNVIIGNTVGVAIGYTVSPSGQIIAAPGATGIRIEGNFIFQNREEGVLIRSSNNTLGGPNDASRNVITANGFASTRTWTDSRGRTMRGYSGVRVTGLDDAGQPLVDANGASVTVSGNEIIANLIGDSFNTDTARRFQGGNARDGVRIEQSSNNRIGGPSADRKNALAASGDGARTLAGVLDQETAGLFILGDRATNNIVQSNQVGFNESGGVFLILPNRDGIRIEAPNNIVGNADGAGNTIDFNSRNGILLFGPNARGNLVQGNFIGTNTQGETDTGNTLSGILIQDAAGNTIGGTATGARNVISGNNWGISVMGAGASGNRIQGNFIGVANDGVTDLGNANEGVRIEGSPGNTIGGTISGAGNTISGNNRGVRIAGAGAIGNLVQGNFIGTDANRSANLGNSLEGVLIEQGASGNTVGGEAAIAGNTIIFNAREGVRVDGAASDGNSILTNSMFRNLASAIALTNAGNNNQPAPTVTSARIQGGVIRLQGTAASVDGGAVRLQFFANDPSLPGAPQTQTFLGERIVPSGAFDVSLAVTVSVGQLVTATATSIGASRDTSAVSSGVVAGLSEPPLIVNTVEDPLDNQIDFNDDIVSLREAILRANADPDQTTVTFNIPGAGVQTIRPTRSLPAVTEPITLLGFTQPGSSLNTLVDGFDSTLQIVISGANLASQTNPDGTLVNGLTLESDDNLVIGVVINQFPGDGILVSDRLGQGRNNQIRNNILGADSTGATLLGNGGAGIRFLAPNNQFGGNVANAKNVVMGNTVGVAIGYTVSAAGQIVAVPGATGVRLEGNFISQNREEGVLIRSSNNTVGGPGDTSRNIITANGFASTRTWTDSRGRTMRGYSGVRITGLNDSGQALVDRNGTSVSVSGNEIVANLIGDSYSTATGSRFRGGNARDGVRIEQASSNRVGGPGQERLNSITDSGNGARLPNGAIDLETAGVFILGDRATSNVVQSNQIGFNESGGALIIFPNRDGIRVEAPGNFIGGTDAAQGNSINYNTRNGILLSGPNARNNLVQGNSIGADAQGVNDNGNTLSGILIQDAANNTIGGTTTGARNVIVGNNWGISILGAASSGNRIQGNFIGVANDGLTDLGNANEGIRIEGAPGNTIGGTVGGAGNVISGNTRGVRISGSSASRNVLQGNLIGVDANAASSPNTIVALGNDSEGVLIDQGANLTMIGGLDEGAGNIIAFNRGEGVGVDGNLAAANSILSNRIFSNLGLGIDLTNGGNIEPNVTPPVLDPFFTDANGTTITGRIVGSLPSTRFLVQFFSDSAPLAADAEGRTLLGTIGVETDASGNATFRFVTATRVAIDMFVTATATDVFLSDVRNTSEFSSAVGSTSSTNPGSVYVVNTTLDTVVANDGLFSLREAILAANANPGRDTIQFNIPGDGPRVIRPLTALPAITDAAIIDGYTQPGSSPNSGAGDNSSSAVIRIVISGNLAGSGVDGLVVNAPQTTIRGLLINQFARSGIAIVGADSVGTAIEGNFIGTDVSGAIQVGLGNGESGVRVESSNNLIGGSSPSTRNLIGGNARGIHFTTTAIGNTARNNILRSNTGLSGSGSVPNGAGVGQGVLVEGANNQVASNLINGNRQGIVIRGPQAVANNVSNNIVGAIIDELTDAVVFAGNSAEGLLIDNASGNVIGNGNQFSGNLYGLAVRGPDSANNVIRNNFVGTNSSGSSTSSNRRNVLDGVLIESGTSIDGLRTGGPHDNTFDNNTISGNGRDGVRITALGRDGNRVAGNGPRRNSLLNNRIGLDVGGTNELGNVQNGITIADSSIDPNARTSFNTIGPLNFITGNNVGILLDGAGVTENTIRGNRIGVGVDTTSDLGNALDGISIRDASNNTIGGSTAADGNIISGNLRGVTITSSSVTRRLDNTISANRIGTDESGLQNVGNLAEGILIRNASGNLIGGDGADQGNILRFNNAQSVSNQQLVIQVGTGNAIKSNIIRVDGGPGIDLGNDGPTPNDAAPDPDPGPNNLQNKPELTALSVAGSTTTVRGRLVGAPNAQFEIQFFRSASTTPFGQADELILPNEATVDLNGNQRFLVRTDANGLVEFTVTFSRVIPLGEAVTAIATALEATATTTVGDSSEFADPIGDVVGRFQFATRTATVDEAAGVVRVVVTRTGSGGTASVLVSTVPPGVLPANVPPGTARPNVDFTPFSATLVFAPGETAKTIEIPILNNNLIDGDRTLNLVLSNPMPSGQAQLGDIIVETVTIQDDDAVQTRFRIRDYRVLENAGTALITIEQVGNDGQPKTAGVPVSVRFRTTDGTARAGVNYLPVDTVVTFQPGETTKVIPITILNDHVVAPDLVANLILSDPTNGATLGRSLATLTIVNTSGPTITSVNAAVGRVLVNGKAQSAVTDLLITFSSPMDKRSIENLNNYSYSLQGAGRDGRFNTVDDVLVFFTAAIYNEATQTVQLRLSRPIALNGFCQLTINQVALDPTSVSGLRDSLGNLLDPDGDGVAGGRLQLTIGVGSKLSYVDKNGDPVSIQLAKGGLFQLTRTADGEGQDLKVLSGTSRSVLSGTVGFKRRRGAPIGRGDRVTTLRSLRGVALVRNRLTRPPFFIGQIFAAAK